jgi:hypothetical protein
VKELHQWFSRPEFPPYYLDNYADSTPGLLVERSGDDTLGRRTALARLNGLGGWIVLSHVRNRWLAIGLEWISQKARKGKQKSHWPGLDWIGSDFVSAAFWQDE